MTKAILKNAGYKYVLVFCSYWLGFLMLIHGEANYHITDMDVLRAMFGEIPVNVELFSGVFVLSIAALSFLHADLLTYILKGEAYLTIRYQKRNRVLLPLFGHLLLETGFAVLLLYLAFVIACLQTGRGAAAFWNQEVCRIIGMGCLTYLLFSLCEMIAMLCLKEHYVFLLMLCLSLTALFLPGWRLGVFSVLPISADGMHIGFHCGINVFYAALLAIIFLVLYRKHEWYR